MDECESLVEQRGRNAFRKETLMEPDIFVPLVYERFDALERRIRKQRRRLAMAFQFGHRAALGETLESIEKVQHPLRRVVMDQPRRETFVDANLSECAGYRMIDHGPQ